MRCRLVGEPLRENVLIDDLPPSRHEPSSPVVLAFPFAGELAQLITRQAVQSPIRILSKLLSEIFGLAYLPSQLWIAGEYGQRRGGASSRSGSIGSICQILQDRAQSS